MTDSAGLTPLMIAGQFARPVPLSLCRALAAPAFRRWEKTWSKPLSGRLEGLNGCLSIRPTGWPVCFDIHVGDTVPNGIRVTLERPDHSQATAIVSATPEVLLELMAAEDGPDGDGAFFSRALSMEGDTGLVMAFRYAIEDTGLNMQALSRDLPGPFVRLIEILSRRLHPVHERMARDIDRAQMLLLAPLKSEIARLNTRLTRMEETMAGPRRPKIVSRKDVPNV